MHSGTAKRWQNRGVLRSKGGRPLPRGGGGGRSGCCERKVCRCALGAGTWSGCSLAALVPGQEEAVPPPAGRVEQHPPGDASLPARPAVDGAGLEPARCPRQRPHPFRSRLAGTRFHRAFPGSFLPLNLCSRGLEQPPRSVASADGCRAQRPSPNRRCRVGPVSLGVVRVLC